MEDLSQYNIAELSYKYSIVLEEFKRAYAIKKEYEERFTRLELEDADELSYKYSLALVDYSKAYANKKAYEEEFSRRAEIKNKKADATGGRIGPYEMVAKEMEEINIE